MKLGFDIDGVISDFTRRFTEIVRERYGVSLTDADMYCSDANLVLGVSREEAVEIAAELVKSDLPLNPLASETLRKLASEGHSIYLLTARSDTLAKYTTAWLEKNSIPYDAIFHLVGGKKYLANVNVDLVVEDNLEDALEYSKTVKRVLILDQPWNKTKNVKALIKRVYSWSEIYDEVQRMAARPI